MPPSGSAAASVMSKPPSRFSTISPGVGPPISQPRRLPFLSVRSLGEGHQRALELPGADHRHRLDAAIGGHALRRRRQGNRPGRRSEPVGGEGVARDPVLALERHVGGALLGVAVDQRHALGIAQGIVAERLAVGAEHGPEHDIAQALQLASVIVERRLEPGAGVGDRQQRMSGRIDRHARSSRRNRSTWRRD